jgi:hypothetical protein
VSYIVILDDGRIVLGRAYLPDCEKWWDEDYDGDTVHHIKVKEREYIEVAPEDEMFLEVSTALQCAQRFATKRDAERLIVELKVLGVSSVSEFIP